MTVETESLKWIAVGLSTISFLGSGIGQGYAAGQATAAVGRNPEAENKIRTMMIIGCAIAESGSIYGLMMALILTFAT